MKPSPALVIGVLLLALGIVVSPASWIDLLRGAESAQSRALHEQGASFFRIGLLALGFYSLCGWKLGWWSVRTDRDASDRWGPDPILLALLGVALAMRLYRLGEGLWLDEILTLANYARLPFGEIVTTFRDQNQHFLFTLLAHTSMEIFGESAWAFRLPSALMGVAAVWALYSLAIQLVDRREALISSALLAFSYHHLWFSQNARGYSAVLFLAIYSSSLLLRGLRTGDPRIWLGYGLAMALGGYTHLTMIFVAVAQFTIYLIFLAQGKLERGPAQWQPIASGFVFAGLFAGTLYSLGMPEFLHTEAESAAAVGKVGVATWKNPLWAIQEFMRSFRLDFGPGVIVAGAGLIVIGFGSVSHWRRSPAIPILFFLPILLIVVAALGIGHNLWPRTFFLIAGFALMILVRGGMAIGDLAARLLGQPEPVGARIGMAGCVVVCLVSLATLPLAYGPKQDYAGARDHVLGAWQSGDGVVTVGIAHAPYKEYFAPDWPHAPSLSAVEDARMHSQRLWLVTNFPPYLEDRLPRVLALIETEFELIGEFPGTLGGGSVFVYRSDGGQAVANGS
jgi:mannosyltransferase